MGIDQQTPKGDNVFTDIRVFNNETKKMLRVICVQTLNTFTECKAKEREKMYFRIVGCIHVTWSFWLLVPVTEEYLLSFSREIVLRQGT